MSSHFEFSCKGSGFPEPCLAEVLNDPLVHAVMARDGVTEEYLRSVICHAQQNLRMQSQR